MKQIIRYKCEICNSEYSSMEKALECENQGEFDVSKFPPIGTMFEYHHNGYVGIFCVGKIEANKHQSTHVGQSSWYAARVEGYPLGVGYDDCLCGGYGFERSDKVSVAKWIQRRFITPEKVNTPEYNRMVNYLIKNGIEPQYYTEEGELIKVSIAKATQQATP